MAERRIKIQKDGVIKYVNENDLDVYIAMGWVEVKDYSTLFQKVK